jgi:hypothetical protein
MTCLKEYMDDIFLQIYVSKKKTLKDITHGKVEFDEKNI